MLQYDAVNIISEVIIKDGLIDCCFLKGSLAFGLEDEHSTIDLYCIVPEHNKQAFLNKRLNYLESYKPLMHYFHLYSQSHLVSYFDNGVQVNLHSITYDEIDRSGKLLIIYDPKKIMNDMQVNDLQFENDDVGFIVNEFTMNLLNIYKYFKRKDQLSAYFYAQKLLMSFSKMYRFYYEPERAKLGFKDYNPNEKEEEYKKLISLIKMIKIDNVLIGVKTITVAMQDLIVNLPITIASYVNFDFFLFGKNQIFSINEE